MSFPVCMYVLILLQLQFTVTLIILFSAFWFMQLGVVLSLCVCTLHNTVFAHLFDSTLNICHCNSHEVHQRDTSGADVFN